MTYIVILEESEPPKYWRTTKNLRVGGVPSCPGFANPSAEGRRGNLTPEVVLRNQTVNKYLFTLKIFTLTHFVSQYFYNGREKMAQLKTKNNSLSLFPAPRTIVSRIFYFFLTRKGELQ